MGKPLRVVGGPLVASRTKRLFGRRAADDAQGGFLRFLAGFLGPDSC